MSNDTNPFKQTVNEQITALREQCRLGKWDISERRFESLLEDAPPWPKGRDTFRLFRIRFHSEVSQGPDRRRSGTEVTIKKHFAAIRRVHGPIILPLPRSKRVDRYHRTGRVRLTHRDSEDQRTEVEWVITRDLSANRERNSICDVRDSDSMTDDGLVLAWLVPDRIRAIDHKEWCGLILGGYQTHFHEREIDDQERHIKEWEGTVVIRRTDSRCGWPGRLSMETIHKKDANPAYSVPTSVVVDGR